MNLVLNGMRFTAVSRSTTASASPVVPASVIGEGPYDVSIYGVLPYEHELGDQDEKSLLEISGVRWHVASIEKLEGYDRVYRLWLENEVSELAAF